MAFINSVQHTHTIHTKNELFQVDTDAGPAAEHTRIGIILLLE